MTERGQLADDPNVKIYTAPRQTPHERASVTARLLRLRAEIDRLTEVGFDPWRYDPAVPELFHEPPIVRRPRDRPGVLHVSLPAV